MRPERKVITVNGHTIEEYYWNGKLVVYVDNHAYVGSYSQAILEYTGDDK